MIDVFTIRRVYVSAPMPDKPDPCFALPDQAVIALHGRDALAFAQAQFMNDVAALADGQWQWNGWLTAQGRVIALFVLLRRDAESLWLVLGDAEPTGFVAALRRYVFRSKVVIELPPLAANGAFEAPQAARGNAAAIIGGAVELDLSGDGGPRRLRIEPAPARDDHAGLGRWRDFDLRHGLPRLSGEPKWTPQQLSLERLNGFSVKKGCYPGQEIVSRTHFLGQAKRGLALFRTPAPLQPGATLDSGDARGSVVSASAGLALAVVALDAPADGWHCEGLALAREALQDGLAR